MFQYIFKKVNVITQLTLKENETSPFVDYIIPKNHFLESWGDSNPKNGMYTLKQPTINPLFNSIQTEDFLLRILDNSKPESVFKPCAAIIAPTIITEEIALVTDFKGVCNEGVTLQTT